MKVKPHQKKSIISTTLNEKRTVSSSDRTNCFVVSFKDIDRNQGDSISDWSSQGLLERLIDTLQGYCCRPLIEQVDNDKFTIYGGFPKESDYEHPKSIPEDAEWARIHIGGKEVVAGHVVKNTFYVVFLDSEHRFYITKKKNT